MRPLLLSLVSVWVQGELQGADIEIQAIGKDSRSDVAGSLYVALGGERFDGHDFASDAVANGARALLVERYLPEVDVPQVVVADTLLALAVIAEKMQAGRAARVIAITGSNGKTSVKALVLSVFGLVGKTYANPGNHNNEVGLPLAVINAPEDADFAIYEMGAGKRGDIAYLTNIVRPDVALVNNVAAAHLERMGSLLGVADTKGAIYAALPSSGVAVINADEAFGRWFEQCKVKGRQVIRFGLTGSAQVQAVGIQETAAGMQFLLTTPVGDVQVQLPFVGMHQVRNALAATSLALACGVPLETIVVGLQQAQVVAGRQQVHVISDKVRLIDDSYNANPASLNAAIDVLGGSRGEKWLVLGDMRELGEMGKVLHAQAGGYARLAGINRLYALGELSAAAAVAFGAGAEVFASHALLVEKLQADLQERQGEDVCCLVKGSRGSAMDRVVTGLLSQVQGVSHAV